MRGLIRFSLSQRLLMLVLVGLLGGVGFYAFKHLAIDAFPEVSPTQVKIIVKAAGMTPEEVESRITAPIEVELLGIPHQSMLRSIAKYALTDITIDFEEGTDIYWARQQIAERLNTLWGNLPAGVEGGICLGQSGFRRSGLARQRAGDGDATWVRKFFTEATTLLESGTPRLVSLAVASFKANLPRLVSVN